MMGKWDWRAVEFRADGTMNILKNRLLRRRKKGVQQLWAFIWVSKQDLKDLYIIY